MARAYEPGGTSSNADKTIAQIAAAAAGRSITTPGERARESGQRYGSDNTGVVTPPTIAPTGAAEESTRESGVLYGSENVGVDTTVNTTSTQTRTLAMDTFRNTLAGFFGADEMTKPWVNALYSVISKYYNTGSTIAESLNLSLQDAKTNPELKEFKDRFAPIYALQDRLQRGEAVTVPTIAEFVKSEADLGDVMREAGLGDLATQKFLGTILTDKSVLTATNIITSVFDRIDNAPKALKDDLTSFMNLGVSRTDIAKALLTGKEGAAALEKKINNLSVYSAAKTQGVTIDMTTAEDLANAGNQYAGSLTGFSNVKKLERANTLAQFGGGSFTQGEAIGATFQQNQAALAKAEAESAKEYARYGGQSGLAASALRGKSARGQI